MAEREPQQGNHGSQKLDTYLGAVLLGLAVGAGLALPVVRLLFFSGPLGELRQAVAPFTLSLGSTWGRGLWALLSLVALLKGTPQGRGLQAGACVAGLAWFALPMVMNAPAWEVAVVSTVLQGAFGALWAASAWPSATSRERAGASIVGGLAVLFAVGVQALGTRIRLGY
ncbi:MAG: hypothetical protein AB7N24_23925 [Dehalococcoidia bacterium]